jgi:hypothetical protein
MMQPTMPQLSLPQGSTVNSLGHVAGTANYSVEFPQSSHQQPACTYTLPVFSTNHFTIVTVISNAMVAPTLAQAHGAGYGQMQPLYLQPFPGGGVCYFFFV